MIQDRGVAPAALVALTTCAALACSSAEHGRSGSPPDLVITGATLIDGTGAPPRPGSKIVVRGDRISAVLPDTAVRVPAGATMIDAAGKHVIPGLVDMHVHLNLGTSLPRDDRTIETALARQLYYGVTSILAIGGTGASTKSIHALRARRAAGELDAPYIYGTGGHLTVHGAHPVYTVMPRAVRRAADSLAAETPLSEPVNLYSLGMGVSLVRSAAAARTAVRERARGGMDAIKITVESGPTTFGDDHPQMPVEMIRAIVDEAGAHGLAVFAHISSLDELEAAVEGGAAGTVHAVWDRPFPDTTLANRMAAAEFYVIPTISLFAGRVSLNYIDEPIDLDDPFLRETVSDVEVAALRDPEFVRRFREGGQVQLDPGSDRAASIQRHMEDLLANVGMLHERGVSLVLGTDTGGPFVFPGYSVHRELELLVRAGLSPMEALEAATRRAAEMLDLVDEFGTIEPGKRADLLILADNPLEDIRNTRTLEAVIAEGRLVDRASLPIQIR